MLYCYICDYIAVALILFFFSVWIWFCRIHNIYFLVSFFHFSFIFSTTICIILSQFSD